MSLFWKIILPTERRRSLPRVFFVITDRAESLLEFHSLWRDGKAAAGEGKMDFFYLISSLPYCAFKNRLPLLSVLRAQNCNTQWEYWERSRKNFLTDGESHAAWRDQAAQSHFVYLIPWRICLLFLYRYWDGWRCNNFLWGSCDGHWSDGKHSHNWDIQYIAIGWIKHFTVISYRIKKRVSNNGPLWLDLTATSGCGKAYP